MATDCVTRYSYLAENLRVFRAQARLTQKQLADSVGPPFSQGYVSELERGLRPRRAEHVQLLAQALGVSASALLSGGACACRHAADVVIEKSVTLDETGRTNCPFCKEYGLRVGTNGSGVVFYTCLLCGAAGRVAWMSAILGVPRASGGIEYPYSATAPPSELDLVLDELTNGENTSDQRN